MARASESERGRESRRLHSGALSAFRVATVRVRVKRTELTQCVPTRSPVRPDMNSREQRAALREKSNKRAGEDLISGCLRAKSGESERQLQRQFHRSRNHCHCRCRHDDTTTAELAECARQLHKHSSAQQRLPSKSSPYVGAVHKQSHLSLRRVGRPSLFYQISCLGQVCASLL